MSRRGSIPLSSALRLALVRSWTGWVTTRTKRQLLRAQRRSRLLGQLLDLELLRSKELEQKLRLLEHRTQELEESRQFRTQGSLPELPPSPLPPELVP